MTRKKIISITISALVSLFVLASAYYFLIRPQPSSGSHQLIRAIPPDAAFILQFEQLGSFLSDFSQTAYWKDLKKMEQIAQIDHIVATMDSSINTNPRAAKFLADYPSAISFHLNQDTSLTFMFLLEMPSVFYRRAFEQIIHPSLSPTGLTRKTHRGKTIYQGNFRDLPIVLTYAFTGGLFLASNDTTVILHTIDHLLSSSEGILDNPSFAQLYSTRGKMVNAHLFINNEQLKPIISLLIRADKVGSLKGFSFPGGWTVLDLFLKEKELLMNGFTAITDTTDTFYRIHLKSGPQTATILPILPYNTVFSVQTGFEQLDVFMDGPMRDSLLDYRFVSPDDPSKTLDLKKRMESIAQKEIAMAFTGPYGASVSDNAYLIVHSDNLANSLISLDLLTDPKTSSIPPAGGFPIRKLKTANPFRIIFSPLASDNTFQWYTTLGDHIIFAKTLSAVQKFAAYYQAGKVLGQMPLYSDYLDNVPDKTNISIQLNIRNAGDAVLTFLKDPVARFIRQSKTTLDRFDGLTVQYSAMGELLYTTIHLNYHPEYVAETPYIWKTPLDSTIQKGPFLLQNLFAQEGYILVFDRLNQMVLLDGSGKIQWKTMLSGPVLSDVFQVYGNRINQNWILFNTADYIYMYDLMGEPVGEYPLPLPSKAVNGLAVFDFEKKKNYRIFVACEDHTVYNFDINGKQVKGWKLPETESIVPFTAEHLVARNKDFLIFTQMDGQVLMTDRRGDTRLRIEKSFTNSTRSGFYSIGSPGSESLVTSDIYGSIIFLTPSGRITMKNFGDFLPDHYFLVTDLDNDRKNDFVFLDRNQLTVFSQSKDTILSFSFEEPINHRPLVFELPSQGTHLGFYSTDSGKIYLFNKDGLLEWSEGIVSDRSFQIGYLKDKNTLHLITGYRNMVYDYLFE